MTLTKAACAIRHNIASDMTRDRELLLRLVNNVKTVGLRAISCSFNYASTFSVNE